jgi:hypothetical protein
MVDTVQVGSLRLNRSSPADNSDTSASGWHPWCGSCLDFVNSSDSHLVADIHGLHRSRIIIAECRESTVHLDVRVRVVIRSKANGELPRKSQLAMSRLMPMLKRTWLDDGPPAEDCESVLDDNASRHGSVYTSTNS